MGEKTSRSSVSSRGNGAVRHVRWDVQYLALVNGHFAPLQLELQSAFEDVGDLLAVMLMERHNRILFQKHLCDHRLLARKDSPGNDVAHLFQRHRFPLCCVCNPLTDCSAGSSAPGPSADRIDCSGVILPSCYRVLLSALFFCCAFADAQTIAFDLQKYPDSPIALVTVTPSAVRMESDRRQFLTVQNGPDKAAIALVFQQAIGERVENGNSFPGAGLNHYQDS